MKRVLALLFLLCCLSCKNVYNELIPNNEQDIISLSLESEDSQSRSISTDINNKHITVKVPLGTNVTRLLVKPKLSKQATLFPLTLKYLQEAFPQTDVVDLALRMSISPTAKSLDKWFLDLYLENPKFNIPPLVFPINFFSPVQFAVIGGQGGVEIYTVKVIYEDGSDPANPPPPPPPAPDEPTPQESEKKILAFSASPYQKGESIIGENTVKFLCKPGTDVRVLVPQVTVSENCVAVPLTKEYLLALAEKLHLDALTIAQGYLTATNKEAFLQATFQPCDISNLTLVLDKPIDFTNPVQFVVVHKGDKTVRTYTITCLPDGDEPHLENIAFSKFQNPQVMKDAIGVIDEARRTIECTVFYPVEYVSTHPEALKMNIDVGYSGESVRYEYDGKTYAEYDAIQFKPVKITQEQYYLGDAVMKVHVLQDGKKVTYTMHISFKEDPNTIRSITDFRFEKLYNREIKATAVASIVNRDDEGEIKATVLYMSDAEPYNLIPSFITGGGASVFVAGVSQLSKQSEQNFSAELEYICVSRDTRYKRTYKVSVSFIKVEKSEAIIKNFSFGMHLNAGLAGDAVGTIDNTTNTINIKVTHTTPTVPKELVPEFASTGLVSVGGILQSSGSSSHSFRYDVYYKVTSIDDATVTRTYRVHVTFNYATESRCELFRFYFTQADNSTLREDIECYIGSASYNISGLLPNGADLASLKPRFEAYGVVKVNDVEQSSGVSLQDFTQVVEYVVISEDGQYSKRYKVKLQVAGEIIYLSADAHGANNGTSWQDAFTTLEAAIEVANKMTAPPEIWATCDNYADKTIRINKAIILRGGFNGTESSKDEREREGGKLKGRLQLTNVTIERYFTKTSRWELRFGDMVFDGLNIIRDDQELEENKGFLIYDKSMYRFFRRYTSSRSYTFDDCIVKDSCISLAEHIGNGIFIKNSTFNAGCKIGVPRNAADSHILSVGKLDIVDSIIAGQLCLRVEHVKIIDSNIEGETIFSLYTLLFKKENATSFCKNMDVNISHNESAKVEIEGVKIDKCTVSYNNRYYIGDVVFKGVQAEQISIYGCLGSVKLEDSIVNNVNDSSRWGKGWTKNLEIMNCGKKDDSTRQCGSFYLRVLNATIKDSWFKGDIDLSIEASPYESAITEVHTTVENLKAKGFRCGKREDVEEITDGNVSGSHMISKSKFTKLVCLGGDEINLEDVEFAKDDDVEIILLNSETPNSKIKLRKVKKEWWDNLTELSCVTNNLIVGEANEAKSGVVLKCIRRVKLNGKNSVDVRESELSCSSNVERDCLFVGSQEVTFTNNRLNDIWLNLDCESAFNIDGNDGEINLSLYYPKGYTFSNKTFSSLELRSESFFSAEFPAINNDEFYVNDCTFKNNFVNKRPHVTLSNPIFAERDVFSYRSGRLQAYSYPLKVKNMKSFATMKIANLKDDETAKISLTDSDIKGPVNDYGYPLNIPYVIELGSKTSLDMENTKISKIVRLMEVQQNAQVTISKNCIFSSIGKLMIGLGATLKIENDSSDLASNPKFFIDNTIWSWNFSSYLNVGNLQMKKVIFEKDYSFTIHNKLEELIFARNATITDSDFKNIGDMCTICVESRICKIENCNFINAGILYVLTSEPTFNIKGGKFENIELHLSMSKSDGSAVIFENVDFFYPDTRIMVLNKFGIPAVDYGPVAVKFEYDIASLPAEVQTRLGGVVNTARIKNFVKTKLLKESNTNRVGYFLNLGNESPSNTSPKKFYGNYH